jgi:hypothetical protein
LSPLLETVYYPFLYRGDLIFQVYWFIFIGVSKYWVNAEEFNFRNVTSGIFFLNKKRNSRWSPGLCNSNLVKLCLNIHWFSWLVKNCTTDPKEKPNIFVKVNASFTKENGTNSNFLWINEVDKDDLNECPWAFNCFEYVSHIDGKRTREYFLTGSDH